MSIKSTQNKYADIRPWVEIAVAGEDGQVWRVKRTERATLLHRRP